MSKKLDGFTEAKNRVINAIDYRIQKLPLNGGILDAATNKAVVERVDELKKLRNFVKGMVTKNEKPTTNEISLELLKKGVD